jgi:hypothetical protein
MIITRRSKSLDKKDFGSLAAGSVFSLDSDLTDNKQLYLKVGSGYAYHLPLPVYKLSFSKDTPVTKYKANLVVEEM